MNNLLEQIYFSAPAWMQNILVSLYGYNLYRKRYGRDFWELRQEVKESRHWTDTQVREYQNEQLFLMIRHCRNNVPYYQKLLADYGFTEQDFTTAKDITKLPVLEKSTVKNNPELFRNSKEKPFTINSTSGTTGTPMVLDINKRAYMLAMALVVDHEEYHGVAFGHRRATFAGRLVQPLSNTRPPFSRYNRAENQRLFSSYHLNERTFPYYRQELDRFQPEELIGYPSALANLASHYIDSGITPGFRPRLIVPNSEMLLSWQKEKMEQVFQCPIRDYYGTAEYITFAGQDYNGRYVTSPILGLTEFLTIGEDIEEKKIVATTLCNTAMPLIRYSIGDTAVCLSEADSGPEGVQRIAQFSGRDDDYILTVDGRRIARLSHIFKNVNGLLEAQVIQDTRNHCRILVVASPDSEVEQKSIIGKFRKHVCTDMELSIEEVPEIPRGPNGKFKSVIRRI